MLRSAIQGSCARITKTACCACRNKSYGPSPTAWAVTSVAKSPVPWRCRCWRSAVQAGDELLQATAAAHQAICQAAEDDPASQGMGTTLVAVRLQAQRFQLVWVGDSRAYRVGPQQIEQLSHDHSWVQSMLDIGQLDAEQARQHPQRNLILQCLGQAGAELQPGWLEGQLADNEILLLCSDGLSSELEDAEILACCNTVATLEELVSQLVGAANAAGGRDNISCLVLAPALAARALPADKPGLLGQWLAVWRNL